MRIRKEHFAIMYFEQILPELENLKTNYKNHIMETRAYKHWLSCLYNL